MSDFSDRPFVAGSLVGLRAFYVDRYGRLVSPSVGEHVFTPGENEAACKADDRVSFTFQVDPTAYLMSSAGAFGSPRRNGKWWFTTGGSPEPVAETPISEAAIEAKIPEPPEHVVGTVKCKCGFYAYFDGRNDYLASAPHERVGGLVEGYGVCTVGTRGFRASKARLIALIQPEAELADPTRWDRVLHNYPDVPVYADKRAALEAHPLAEGMVPTPETNEDFWTLGVAR